MTVRQDFVTKLANCPDTSWGEKRKTYTNMLQIWESLIIHNFAVKDVLFMLKAKNEFSSVYKSWSSTCIYCTSLGPVHALWNLQTSYMPNGYFYQHLINGSTKQATIAVHTCSYTLEIKKASFVDKCEVAT